MLEDLGSIAVSLVILLLVAIAVSPRRAECPRGYWLNGVRPSGAFECVRDGRPELDNEHSDLHRVSGRLDCLPSFMPIVVDDRHAACAGASTIP
jgi:hypothetical protein